MTRSKNSKKLLEWSLKAFNDRIKILDYIELNEFNPINAALVDGRIADALDFLSAYPLAGTKFTKTLFLYPVRKTQFTIIYQLTPKKLVIARISHQKRKKI